MRAGVLFGIAAYGLWGVFPLYLHLLDDIRPMEVVANRIAWSLIVVAAILFVTRRLGRIGPIMRDRRRLRLLAAAAVLIAVNWAVYIYAISVDRVIEGALGYFITPLVSVAFGLTVLTSACGARRPSRWPLAPLAVVVLTVYYGGFPWISVTLGLSFGTYGLLKKLVNVPTAEALAVETLLLFLPAIALMAGLAWTGEGALFSDGPGTTLLLIGAGPVTADPAAALRRERDARAADHDRADAVHHPGAAVPHRLARPGRGDAGHALGRLRPRVVGARRADLGRPARRAPRGRGGRAGARRGAASNRVNAPPRAGIRPVAAPARAAAAAPGCTRARASTASAPAGPAITGLHSISAISGCASASAASRTTRSTSASVSHRGAPR